MGTRTLCMSRGACSTSSSTYPRGVSRSCRMHWSAVSHRSTRSKHTMVPGRAASIARQLGVSTAFAARISSASSARMTRGGGTRARAWRSSKSWRSRSLNSSVGLSMTRTLGYRLQMARLSSVERWSAMMMWSANLLVTVRNRSRIHASLRTGVTTTTRTRSDTVLRYDGGSERETVRGVGRAAVAAPEPARYCGRRGTRGGPMPEQLVGTVVHYFKGPSVAVVRVTEGALAVGDRIRFHGHTTDFTEQITSMEVNHQKVPLAKAGDEVAIQVADRTRQHDQVFKVTP